MEVNNQPYDMAEYAYNTVPLYARRGGYKKGMKWEDIPLLTKEEILADEDSFYSCTYLGGDREKEVLEDRTSGSTGKYMRLYWHRADAGKSLLTVWMYRMKYYHIHPSDRMCYFFTSSNIGYRDGIEYSEEESGNVKGFSKSNLNSERMLEVYREMTEYRPVWLFLQPSMASLLCDAAEKAGAKIESLRYIEFTGELLTDEVRQRTEKVFGCVTANHYGCNEMHTIAFECPCGKMHIAAHNVYAEIVDDNMNPVPNGHEGRIVLTSLSNRIMPFIRYDIGDRGMIMGEGKTCGCGCTNPVLQVTRGRENDYALTKEGMKVNAYVFVHAAETVNRKYENCIKQFQIIQESYEKFHVKLALDEEILEMGVTEKMLEEEFINNVVQKEFEDMEYEFSFCSELFPEGDKLLWFRREMNRG